VGGVTEVGSSREEAPILAEDSRARGKGPQVKQGPRNGGGGIGLRRWQSAPVSSEDTQGLSMGPKDGGTGEERKEEVRAGRTQVLNRLGYSILQMRKQPRKEKR
jgi:hypothetical protein